MGWRGKAEREVGDVVGRDQLRRDWVEGIRTVVLSRAAEKLSCGTGSGAAEEAASMMAEYGWTDGTWNNRVSQLRKWLLFCDEEGRDSLPAGEGAPLEGRVDSLPAAVNQPSPPVEGRVGMRSARQCVTMVSDYHEDAGYNSPTKTCLV